MTDAEKKARDLADEFRRVMKGFDVYLEQSPNPRELKIHIAAALKLNGEIHRLAALEDAEMVAAGIIAVANPKLVAALQKAIRALKGGKA